MTDLTEISLGLTIKYPCGCVHGIRRIDHQILSENVTSQGSSSNYQANRYCDVHKKIVEIMKINLDNMEEELRMKSNE